MGSTGCLGDAYLRHHIYDLIEQAAVKVVEEGVECEGLQDLRAGVEQIPVGRGHSWPFVAMGCGGDLCNPAQRARLDSRVNGSPVSESRETS